MGDLQYIILVNVLFILLMHNRIKNRDEPSNVFLVLGMKLIEAVTNRRTDENFDFEFNVTHAWWMIMGSRLIHTNASRSSLCEIS